MFKYCLTVIGFLLLGCLTADLIYQDGVKDGVMQEKSRLKTVKQCGDKSLDFFLEDSDIPNNYLEIPKKKIYKL